MSILLGRPVCLRDQDSPTAKRIVGSIKTGAMGERYGDPSETSEDMDGEGMTVRCTECNGPSCSLQGSGRG